MRELVFATNNRHKVDEVADKVGDKIKLLTLKEIGCHEDIDETGTTFRANASLKSRYVFEKYKLSCFADDSGLEVEALKREPGVYSARYAGMHGDHAANIAKVLEKLGDSPNRNARFVTVISLIWDGHEYFFEGTVKGTIRHKPSGINGFGYDPIFQPEGYNITFAEMSLEQKNSMSHRARAMEMLVEFLKGV